ncbi:peptidoglycan bridge formation glycyltransferase FemA/FemB family protein, partial [Candidatus Saccharibacteria bacterium]|nr:peptidoglycan bridge formation glycyltransferase FemA/FemB family protein [Candidatus Saccharibacteria bacterium]
MLSVKDIAPEALDKFVVKEHPELNFLQAADWGKVHEVDGFKVRYLGLFDGEKLIGSAMVVVKNAKRGRFMEIPAGPVLDWEGKIQPIRFFIDELKRIANEEKCVFVRIRPNIDNNEKHQKLFEKLGLRLAPFHLHADNTVMLDLTKSEDELMADMRR